MRRQKRNPHSQKRFRCVKELDIKSSQTEGLRYSDCPKGGGKERRDRGRNGKEAKEVKEADEKSSQAKWFKKTDAFGEAIKNNKATEKSNQ